MRKTLAIAQKELSTYFKTPMAYLIMVITISAFNVFFFMILDQNREASLRDMFKLMEFMFVFIVPLLTMKVFAEEKRMGTMEFLLTNPVWHWQIVIGKFLGSLGFFTAMIAMTTVYLVILRSFSSIDILAACVGYGGIWLEGALFIAVGIFFSSLTRNQIIAALSTYAVLLFFYLSISFMKYFSVAIKPVIRAASFWGHMENFSSGLIMSSSVVYFISGITLFLILTVLCLKNQNQ